MYIYLLIVAIKALFTICTAKLAHLFIGKLLLPVNCLALPVWNAIDWNYVQYPTAKTHFFLL